MSGFIFFYQRLNGFLSEKQPKMVTSIYIRSEDDYGNAYPPPITSPLSYLLYTIME